jgi:hypothetical protein
MGHSDQRGIDDRAARAARHRNHLKEPARTTGTIVEYRARRKEKEMVVWKWSLPAETGCGVTGLKEV